MLTKEEKEKVETRISKLEAEIAEDKLKDKMIDDDMEQMVQTTLTVYEGGSMYYFLAFLAQGIRELMTEWTEGDVLMFGTVAKLEEQWLKFNDVIADGAGDLKTEMSKLFQTFRKVS